MGPDFDWMVEREEEDPNKLVLNSTGKICCIDCMLLLASLASMSHVSRLTVSRSVSFVIG